jgi:hypothetical protein
MNQEQRLEFSLHALKDAVKFGRRAGLLGVRIKAPNESVSILLMLCFRRGKLLREIQDKSLSVEPGEAMSMARDIMKRAYRIIGNRKFY